MKGGYPEGNYRNLQSLRSTLISLRDREYKIPEHTFERIEAEMRKQDPVMKITITGVKQAPRWETLQTVIRESLKDENVMLIGISRRDRGVDYRGLGEYDLTLRNKEEESKIELEVK